MEGLRGWKRVGGVEERAKGREKEEGAKSSLFSWQVKLICNFNSNVCYK